MSERKTTLDPRSLRASLITVLTLIMVLVVVMFGVVTLSAFDRAIAPELENRTRLIGSILRGEVQRTLDLGIPLEALGGLENHITAVISDFSEIKRIAIVEGEKNLIAEVEREEAPSLLQRTGFAEFAGIGSAQFSFPILVGNELVGEIQVEGSPQFVETKLREVFLDVTVLSIVALFLGVELALAVAASSVWKPYGRVTRLLSEQASGQFIHIIRTTGVSGIRRVALRLNAQAEDLAERARKLPDKAKKKLGKRISASLPEKVLKPMQYSDFHDVRLALFLYVTAAEITASFLPVYARDATRPEWLSGEMSAAAPLAFYLIAVALLSPFGGFIAGRFGPRAIFVASAVPTAVALIGMGLAESLAAVTAWRGLIGVFYALATIACHEYAIRAGSKGEAAQLSSAFIGMIFGGAFCGSVLGGVIGGRFGFPVAIFFGAGMALIAGAVAYAAMRGSAGEPYSLRSPSAPPAPAQDRRQVHAFWTLLLCVAVPMSATTAVFIWYVTPLGLTALGHEPGTVARVVMVYFLATTLIGPISKSLSENHKGAVLLVVFGAFVAGTFLWFFRSTNDLWVFVAAVSGCGIGHALIRVPMTTLAVDLSGGSGRMLSALRLGERLGALVGLSGAAIFLSDAGAGPALASLGSVSLAGGVLFGIVFLRSNGRKRSNK